MLTIVDENYYSTHKRYAHKSLLIWCSTNQKCLPGVPFIMDMVSRFCTLKGRLNEQHGNDSVQLVMISYNIVSYYCIVPYKYRKATLHWVVTFKKYVENNLFASIGSNSTPIWECRVRPYRFLSQQQARYPQHNT